MHYTVNNCCISRQWTWSRILYLVLSQGEFKSEFSEKIDFAAWAKFRNKAKHQFNVPLKKAM